ncbi:hypothetical protein B0H15DRAFT_988135 [Mycena belliarum]|uniref:Uncharacterized protein n=1 Tax=Mycena belliarum TaxID=1033014 RepID=A0AAD6U265_9AGAR|nr:hypothetical protein B0H15DRAFT_988135 [Mycena belliae]
MSSSLLSTLSSPGARLGAELPGMTRRAPRLPAATRARRRCVSCHAAVAFRPFPLERALSCSPVRLACLLCSYQKALAEAGMQRGRDMRPTCTHACRSSGTARTSGGPLLSWSPTLATPHLRTPSPTVRLHAETSPARRCIALRLPPCARSPAPSRRTALPRPGAPVALSSSLAWNYFLRSYLASRLHCLAQTSKEQPRRHARASVPTAAHRAIPNVVAATALPANAYALPLRPPLSRSSSIGMALGALPLAALGRRAPIRALHPLQPHGDPPPAPAQNCSARTFVYRPGVRSARHAPELRFWAIRARPREADTMTAARTPPPSYLRSRDLPLALHPSHVRSRLHTVPAAPAFTSHLALARSRSRAPPSPMRACAQPSIPPLSYPAALVSHPLSLR